MDRPYCRKGLYLCMCLDVSSLIIDRPCSSMIEYHRHVICRPLFYPHVGGLHLRTSLRAVGNVLFVIYHGRSLASPLTYINTWSMITRREHVKQLAYRFWGTETRGC
jgi:hypothetical protein